MDQKYFVAVWTLISHLIVWLRWPFCLSLDILIVVADCSLLSCHLSFIAFQVHLWLTTFGCYLSCVWTFSFRFAHVHIALPCMAVQLLVCSECYIYIPTVMVLVDSVQALTRMQGLSNDATWHLPSDMHFACSCYLHGLYLRQLRQYFSARWYSVITEAQTFKETAELQIKGQE